MTTYKNFTLKTENARNGMRLTAIYDGQHLVGWKDTFADARKAIDNGEIKMIIHSNDNDEQTDEQYAWENDPENN